MSRGRWWRRLAAAVVAFLALEVGLTLADTGPDAPRLALLVATCVGVLGLVTDGLGGPPTSWLVEVEKPSVRATADPRLARYVQVLSAHRSARAEDSTLRDRLAGLAAGVLRQRHGLAPDDPRAAELLGPEVVAVLTGPPRRLDPAEIDHILTRIEDL